MDAPAPFLRPEFLDDFYAEADDYLGNIRTQLGRVETAVGKGGSSAEALESLFRSMHSLKGICAMAGVAAAERLAHATEDILRQLSRGQIAFDATAFGLLANATRELEQMITSHRLHQPVVPTPAVLADLAAFREATVAALETEGTSEAEHVAAPSVPKDAAHFAGEARTRGLAPWRCTFVPSRELDQRGVNINAVRTRLGEIGEILGATPLVREDGSIAFEFVVGTRTPPAALERWAADGLRLEPMPEPPAPSAVTPPARETNPQSPSLSVAPSHIVRVDLSRLDELMQIAGEMVMHRSRLDELLNQPGIDRGRLKEVSHGLGRSLRQLRAGITRVRLVPIGEIFNRMAFVVRDLARDSDKRVRLAVDGQQTEIDKYLVERLKEPVLHLVRNAFSHGIEPPAERAKAGKTAEAALVLRATAAGEFVVIEVSDDGRGIAVAAVTERARAAGLPVPDPLDSAGLLALLCTAGFSTRDEADRTSGRGVGMAAVYATVRELGGNMSLVTEAGRGTRITLRLPLTLSIADTLIVSAADQTCAVPQAFVQEIIQVAEADVRTIRQTEVIPYRDGLLPLVRLRSMFGAERSAQPACAVLVLASEHGAKGLVVDRVHTQREIVVRPMPDPLLQVPGISGATELGDGRPVLILDPVAITDGAVRPHAGRVAAGPN